ncbi:hypothetical protein [Mycolicibacterium peregrinum]|nr:hypothetical protein [Mycolicibacterium peregrinum]
MTRVLAALAGGVVLGLAMFATFGWAFVKGCPIFDHIRDRDTTHSF